MIRKLRNFRLRQREYKTTTVDTRINFVRVTFDTHFLLYTMIISLAKLQNVVCPLFDSWKCQIKYVYSFSAKFLNLKGQKFRALLTTLFHPLHYLMAGMKLLKCRRLWMRNCFCPIVLGLFFFDIVDDQNFTVSEHLKVLILNG